MAQATLGSLTARYRTGVTRRGQDLLADVAAAGFLSALLVAIGGFALGLMLWYEGVTRTRTLHAVTELWFPAALAIGVALAFAGYGLYGRYFAARTDVDVRTALRWDAVSWLPLTIFALALLAPPGILPPTRGIGAAFALFALAKLLVAARFNATVRSVATTFVVTRLPIIVIAELAFVLIGQRAGHHVATSDNPLLAVWGRWDSVHYLRIAHSGYYGTDMAFFPLYPYLIKFLTPLAGNGLVAGLLISNVAFFFGLLYFYKLVEHQYTRAVAHRAVFYVSIFPTAIFFSAVYTEALFFALTVASFYYIREHKWLAAGILGFFASLSRVEGVLLFLPLAIEVFSPSPLQALRDLVRRPERTLKILAGAALIPLGLLTYMALLWVIRGDPLYFSHVQSHWNRHLAPPWVSIQHAFRVIAHAKSAQTISNQAIEVVFTALMLGVLGFGFLRLKLPYTAFMIASIAVPMSTSSLMSMPRFALVLFPMFVILALWGGRSWVNSAIVAFSLPLLGLFTVLFANWYWVA